MFIVIFKQLAVTTSPGLPCNHLRSPLHSFAVSLGIEFVLMLIEQVAVVVPVSALLVS